MTTRKRSRGSSRTGPDFLPVLPTNKDGDTKVEDFEADGFLSSLLEGDEPETAEEPQKKPIEEERDRKPNEPQKPPTAAQKPPTKEPTEPKPQLEPTRKPLAKIQPKRVAITVPAIGDAVREVEDAPRRDKRPREKPSKSAPIMTWPKADTGEICMDAPNPEISSAAVSKETPTQPPDRTSQGIRQLAEVLQKTRRQLKHFYREYKAHEKTCKDPTELSEGLDERLDLLVTKLKVTNQRLKELKTESKRSSSRLDEMSPRLDRFDKKLQSLNEGRVGEPSRDDEPAPEPVELTEKPNLPVQAPVSSQESEQALERFLMMMKERCGSVLHLSVGCSPMIRIGGVIHSLHLSYLGKDEWIQLHRSISPEAKWEQYERTGDARFVYALSGVGRFHVSLSTHATGGASALRALPERPMTIEQLGLPETIHRIPMFSDGLVLITGPRESGKTTTIAAIIAEVNERFSRHIIMLEDPIEYRHKNVHSLVHQREIVRHATDTASGLKDAMRADPDLLVVGELSAPEIVRLALRCARKGTCVIATLFSRNAAGAVEHIISSFPESERPTIQALLAETLRAVVAHQRVEQIGDGKATALEVLFADSRLSTLIRSGRTNLITNYIRTQRRDGSMVMDDSLRELVDTGVIENTTALEYAIEQSSFLDETRVNAEAKLLKEVLKTAD